MAQTQTSPFRVELVKHKAGYAAFIMHAYLSHFSTNLLQNGLAQIQPMPLDVFTSIETFGVPFESKTENSHGKFLSFSRGTKGKHAIKE